MPPGPGAKRKRGDRTYSGDDGGRPSPYRPGNTGLGQQHGYSGGPYHTGAPDARGRGRGRGGGRGGRGGGPRSPDGPNGSYQQQARGTYGQHHHHQQHQYSQHHQNQHYQTSHHSSHPSSRPGSQQFQHQPQQASDAAPVNAVPDAAVAQSAPAATPQQQIVEPAPARVMEVDENFDEPEGPIAPYSYDHVTDDIVKVWEEDGKETLLSNVKELMQSKDDIVLNTVYLELLRSALDGRLHPSEVGRFVKDVLAIDIQDEETDVEEYVTPTSAFLDTVSMLGEADKKSRRLAVLLWRSEVSQDTMREELDSDVLANLNLVRPVVLFNKSFVRYQTNVLYRQANYNLLREETEGYSKLLTELFSTSEDETPSAEVVKATFERVRSMIGTFDLGVGRTLDVTLDVFAAVIVKHHRFFVKFLRASSWWPQEALNSPGAPDLPHWAMPESDGLENLTDEEKAELDARRQMRDTKFWEHARELLAQGKGILAFFRLRGLDMDLGEAQTTQPSEEDARWREITGTDPPTGNKVAAQILGFKLRYYSSQARDAQDELPTGLIHLTALLIKIGFISLRDIYPHLWPEDAAMDKVREQKQKEKDERDKELMPSTEMNALAMAGALSDDTVPVSAKSKEAENLASSKTEAAAESTEGAQDALPEPKDAKIELLKALLCIGALPDALYMIGRFPWLLDLVLDLPEYIHRIVHHSLQKLYDPIRPLQTLPELRRPGKAVDPDQSGVSKGGLRRTERVQKRSLRWLRLEQYKEEESVFYRYYWDDWNDNVPVCQSIDDLFTLCDTFLNLTGVKIGQDPLLLAKLIRIGAKSLKDDPSAGNQKRWVDLCKKLLVPALSLTRHNPGIMNEMYHDILKRFPIATRYAIYSEWYLGATSRLPAMAAAFNLCRAETKALLKRVSRNNVKQSARPLAKVSTSSPGITFQVAITQMENFQNLVECFIECARYLTDLGYDVLAWATLQALGRQGRVKTSADGLFTSKWLISLASFIGRVYWRYKMLDPDPILQYLDHQLAKGNPNDLKVLEDMISSMGGINELTYNDGQILALSGGPLLQKQALISMLDKRHESRSTAERLRTALVRSRCVSSILVALAQECQTRLHTEAENGAPLKLQGNVHDEMHRLFVQYYDFLKAWLPEEQYERLIPGFAELINDFGLEPRMAFFISRVTIGIQVDEYVAAKSEQQKEDAAAAKEAGASARAETGDTEMEDVQNKSVDTRTRAPDADAIPWTPILKNMIDQTRDTIGPQTLSLVGELFYMTFWQLSLNDMVVSFESYEEEIARLKEKVREINQDRSDLTIYGTKKREEKRNVLNRLQDQLRAEMREQLAKYSTFTRSRMSKEKEHWFAHTWGKHDQLNSALLENCFIPRMTMSPLDAYYCFKMFKMLHSTGAKNFRTMGFLDQFFNQKRLTVLFYMCTSKEAENMARFINEVLKDLGKWHASQSVYEKEACGPKKDLPGFCLRIGSDKSQYHFLPYADFRRLLFKWHGQLANALRHCLEANEYMHIRNAISLLRGVVTTFPAVDMQYKKLLEAVTALSKTESRGDIKLAAVSLINMLTRRELNHELVPHASFHQMPRPGGVPQTSGTQIANEVNRMFNARARDFKPTGGPTVRSERPEPEDGEINSPVVADGPRQTTNGVRQAPAASNLGGSVANADSPAPAHASSDRIAGARDGTPRASTPKADAREGRDSPAPATGQPSRDGGRTLNGRNNPSRAPHALPARPEASVLPTRRPERGMPLRPDDRGGREARPVRDIREGRDAQGPEHVRNGRLGEPPGNRPGDRPNAERSYDRMPERLPPADRERAERVEPSRRGDIHGGRHSAAYEDRSGRSTLRDDKPLREPRDRSARDPSTERTSRERPGADGRMPPPAPVLNAERAQLIQGNPGRDDADAPGRHSRHSTSRPGSDRGSRAPSPVRKEEREPRLSNRTERPPPGESLGRPYADDRRSGPRSEREPFIGHDDRSRGSARTGPPPESGYGRPPRDYGPPPGESQYGRLNGPDPTPTGPRTVNGSQPPGRLQRTPSGPASQGPPSDRPPPLDRQAPSGPASNRPGRLGSFSRPPPASSAPSTPGAESPSTGVHPDRAARLGLSGQSGTGPPSPVDAPRGPSGTAQGGSSRPAGPPNPAAPPSPVNERGRGNRQFDSINTTLQQGGGSLSRSDQGASIRGRGARNPPPSPLGPGPGPGPLPPSGPGRYDGPPPRGEGSHSRDLFAEGGPDGGRGPPREFNNARQPRRTGRSASPPGNRGPRPQGLVTDDQRPGPPRRNDSRDMRPRGELSHTPQGPSEREPRRGRGDDYGSGKDYSSRHGGNRRDVRDIPWGGERGGDRSDSRGGAGPTLPDGPGSGRKRLREFDEHSDPKRSRRGGREGQL